MFGHLAQSKALAMSSDNEKHTPLLLTVVLHCFHSMENSVCSRCLGNEAILARTHKLSRMEVPLYTFNEKRVENLPDGGKKADRPKSLVSVDQSNEEIFGIKVTRARLNSLGKQP